MMTALIVAACEVLIVGGKPVTVCPLPSPPSRCSYTWVCDSRGRCRTVEVCK